MTLTPENAEKLTTLQKKNGMTPELTVNLLVEHLDSIEIDFAVDLSRRVQPGRRPILHARHKLNT